MCIYEDLPYVKAYDEVINNMINNKATDLNSFINGVSVVLLRMSISMQQAAGPNAV